MDASAHVCDVYCCLRRTWSKIQRLNLYFWCTSMAGGGAICKERAIYHIIVLSYRLNDDWSTFLSDSRNDRNYFSYRWGSNVQFVWRCQRWSMIFQASRYKSLRVERFPLFAFSFHLKFLDSFKSSLFIFHCFPSFFLWRFTIWFYCTILTSLYLLLVSLSACCACFSDFLCVDASITTVIIFGYALT